MNLRSSDIDAEPLLVCCLCARWCSLCEVYRGVFDGVAAADASGVRYQWLDIEDDEALLGPIEVDDFPTLLIARGTTVLFFGPLTPQPVTLARLVDRARDDALDRVETPELAALAQRIASVPARVGGCVS